jgi:hypothetical protein
MKCSKQFLLKVLLAAVLFSPRLLSQPYYYYFTPVDPKGSITNVYQVDLSTGQKELFLTDSSRIQNLDWNQNQSWLYVTTRYDFQIVETASRRRHILISNEDFTGSDGAILIPQLNKLFVSWLRPYGREGSTISQTYVFDPSSFALLDSEGIGVRPSSIISEDGTRAFDYGPDSSGNYTVFCTDLLSGKMVSNTPLIDVGPHTKYKTYLGGKSGRSLIRYGLEFADKRYCVVDLASNIIETDFPFPWRSEAQLTPDGKRILVEEVQFINDNNPDTPAEYRPGRVYIFDAESGALLQRLSLPPEGRVLTFENYPEKLFYYNDVTMQSIPVDVTIVTPDITLLDTLVSLKHQAEAESWLADKNFVNELDNHLENAQKHLAKGDSVNARKEIEKFQEKVDEEYQKTSDDQKKGKARDKRFVTEDGWKLLYFNAQYIIERLPAKSKNQKADKDKKPKK